VARVGRRPGKVDTRAQILRAARAAFDEAGYAGTSIRAVARRAGVDAALVHHFFTDKAGLFVAVMELPVDPVPAERVAVAGGSSDGERVVEGFLAQWEQGPGPGGSFRALAQGICESPRIAERMRELLAEGTWGGTGHGREVERRRSALVWSQLVGLAWARYVVGIEPLASADRAEVARWVGPTIDHYARGGLPAGLRTPTGGPQVAEAGS